MSIVQILPIYFSNDFVEKRRFFSKMLNKIFTDFGDKRLSNQIKSLTANLLFFR